MKEIRNEGNNIKWTERCIMFYRIYYTKPFLVVYLERLKTIEFTSNRKHLSVYKNDY